MRYIVRIQSAIIASQPQPFGGSSNSVVDDDGYHPARRPRHACGGIEWLSKFLWHVDMRMAACAIQGSTDTLNIQITYCKTSLLYEGVCFPTDTYTCQYSYIALSIQQPTQKC